MAATRGNCHFWWKQYTEISEFTTRKNRQCRVPKDTQHPPICGSGNEIRHFASLQLGALLVMEIRDLYDVEGTSVHYKRTFRILQTGLPYTTNAPSIHYKWGLRRVWKMGSDEVGVEEVFGGVLNAEVIAGVVVDAHEAPGHGVVARDGEGYMAHRAAEIEFHAGVEKPIS